MIAALAAGALALSVSPARIALVAPAARRIELRNAGTARVVVDVARRPVDGRTSPAWLQVHPSRLAIRGGAAGVLTLRVPAHTAAEAGDHELLVLLTARPSQRTTIAVRLRLNVRVRIRVPGVINRRLVLLGLSIRRRVRGRVLFVSVANHGNVTEQIRGRLSVTLIRGRRIVSRLRLRGRGDLLPGTRRAFALPYAGSVRGPATAVVQLRVSGSGPPLRRRFRLRL
jgi:hypothetical protein